MSNKLEDYNEFLRIQKNVSKQQKDLSIIFDFKQTYFVFFNCSKISYFTFDLAWKNDLKSYFDLLHVKKDDKRNKFHYYFFHHLCFLMSRICCIVYIKSESGFKCQLIMIIHIMLLF